MSHLLSEEEKRLVAYTDDEMYSESFLAELKDKTMNIYGFSVLPGIDNMSNCDATPVSTLTLADLELLGSDFYDLPSHALGEGLIVYINGVGLKNLFDDKKSKKRFHQEESENKFGTKECGPRYGVHISIPSTLSFLHKTFGITLKHREAPGSFPPFEHTWVLCADGKRYCLPTNILFFINSK